MLNKIQLLSENRRRKINKNSKNNFLCLNLTFLSKLKEISDILGSDTQLQSFKQDLTTSSSIQFFLIGLLLFKLLDQKDSDLLLVRFANCHQYVQYSSVMITMTISMKPHSRLFTNASTLFLLLELDQTVFFLKSHINF